MSTIPARSMENFAIWAVIKRVPDGKYRVRVKSIPVGDQGMFVARDELGDTCGTFVAATERRDQLVSQVKRRIFDRGDGVASVDSTFEV